jgi:hypothetical protein
MKRFTVDADHTDERRVVTLKWVSIDWPSYFVIDNLHAL